MDSYEDFSKLNLSEVDFNRPEWSWSYNKETNKGWIIFTDLDSNDDFYSIRYLLPEFINHLVKMMIDSSLGDLKLQLRVIEQQRRSLLGYKD